MRMTEEEYQAYLNRARMPVVASKSATPSHIIRQSTRGLKETEKRFLTMVLEPWKRLGEIDTIGEHESITLKIGNGVRVSFDFPTWKDGKLTLYEVKGAYIREDAIIKLKTAASKYPQIPIWLYQWKRGQWLIQRMLS